MLNLAVSGFTGRIGSLVAEVISEHADLSLIQTFSNKAGLKELLPTVGLFIDFSVPEATIQYAEWCVKSQVPMVIGTTGVSIDQQKMIEACAKKIPILQASNMSLGINILYTLTAQAQKMLKGMYNVQIIEAHRKEKRDMPSGTALELKRILETIVPKQAIDVASIRIGELCGEHQVWMVGSHERLELHHQAFNRRTFAEGAITAARWLKTQRPGLYSMQNVLGFL